MFHFERILPIVLILLFTMFAFTGQTKRIKGGEIITENSRLSFPHHLQLVTYREETVRVFCGGTLIGKKYLSVSKILPDISLIHSQQIAKCFLLHRVALTAAHCLLSNILENAVNTGQIDIFRVYSGMFQRKNLSREE